MANQGFVNILLCRDLYLRDCLFLALFLHVLNQMYFQTCVFIQKAADNKLHGSI
jgi:hypothetical protein